jgi:group I intron endonuclease
MGELYRITSPSGKDYIGITSRTAEERFKDHVANAGRKSPDGLLIRAIRKYGADRMVVETLAVSDDWDALCAMEQEAIAIFGTRAPRGMNATDGGDGVLGYDPPAEVRSKVGAASRRVWQDKGYREKQSDDFKRRWADPEFRAMMVAKLALRFDDPEYREKLRKRQATAGFAGRLHSAEARRKMSLSRKGNKNALGLRHSAETVARIAEKNRNPSPETRARKSASAKIGWEKRRGLHLPDGDN